MLNSKMENVVLSPAVQSEIYSCIYKEIAPLSAEVMVTEEPVKFKDRMNYEYYRIERGEKWGNLWIVHGSILPGRQIPVTRWRNLP